MSSTPSIKKVFHCVRNHKLESADLGNFVLPLAIDAVAEICKWFSLLEATNPDASGRRGAKMKIQKY